MEVIHLAYDRHKWRNIVNFFSKRRVNSEPVWTTWRSENSFPNRYSNSDPLVDQSIASRYTGYAIGLCQYSVNETITNANSLPTLHSRSLTK
jgi:hypothetical protein